MLLLLMRASHTLGQEMTGFRSGGQEIRPIVVWPSGPLDVTAAFNRPIDSASAKSLIGLRISYSDNSSVPPGQVTKEKSLRNLRIVGARLIDGGRTLVLATDPHSRATRYRLPFGTSYELTGVEATWSHTDKQSDDADWSGWWPELIIHPTQQLVLESKPHADGFAHLSQPGRLTLSTLIRLPAGRVQLSVASSGPIEEAILGDVQVGESVLDSKDGSFHCLLTVESKDLPLFLSVTVRTGANKHPFSFKAVYRQDAEQFDRSIERSRLVLPWSPQLMNPAMAMPITIPNLSGGDPARGRTIFIGAQGRCAQCHTFRGQGGKVGPDLTEIGQKGRAELYRNIASPSASIEPEYTSYTVATKSGQLVAGIVRAENPDTIQVTDTNAHTTVIRREEIREVRPSATSIMPPGLASALGDAAVRDIIEFLSAPGFSEEHKP